MDVAIGLPNAVPGTTGEQLTVWARRADARGFSSLGTIDRKAYSNYEPMVALAAAAAVTERIGLATTVLLGPLRGNAAALAKQALSLHALSGGRFTLGIGIGGREDDYDVAEVDMGDRGETIDAMLGKIRSVWDDERVGPRAHGSPAVLVGGSVDASFARAARYGDGWIAGGAPPEVFAEAAAKVRDEWSAAGREDQPRLAGLAYFSLGERAEADANAYLTDYYAWLGEDVANFIANSAAKDAETVQGYLAAFEAVGCDELFIFPSSGDPDQVDLLADAGTRALTGLPTLLFAGPAEFEAWLGEHHGEPGGLWLKIAKKGVGAAQRHLRRGARAGALLRLDRQPEARLRRAPLPAALHAAAPARALVEDQPREGRGADRGGEDAPGGAGRGRGGQRGRPLGGRLRGPAHRQGPGGPAARARRQPRRGSLLRRPRRRQPLRDRLPARRGEAGGDAGAAAAQVPRHARARREDPRANAAGLSRTQSSRAIRSRSRSSRSSGRPASSFSATRSS